MTRTGDSSKQAFDGEKTQMALALLHFALGFSENTDRGQCPGTHDSAVNHQDDTYRGGAVLNAILDPKTVKLENRGSWE